MKLEAITLALTLAAGTLLVTGWDAPEGKAAPEVALLAPVPAQGKNARKHLPQPEAVVRGPESVQAAVRPPG